MRSTAIAMVLALGLSQTVFAQQREDPASDLGRRLRLGDRVWVEISTTDVRTGRVLGVANGVLRLRADGVEERIPVNTIWRVQRKQNGIVLGTLIGAGVGFTLGLPIAAIGANEGTGVASPLLFMTGIGAAAGAGLDAVLWTKRTVYAYQRAGWSCALSSVRIAWAYSFRRCSRDPVVRSRNIDEPRPRSGRRARRAITWSR